MIVFIIVNKMLPICWVFQSLLIFNVYMYLALCQFYERPKEHKIRRCLFLSSSLIRDWNLPPRMSEANSGPILILITNLFSTFLRVLRIDYKWKRQIFSKCAKRNSKFNTKNILGCILRRWTRNRFFNFLGFFDMTLFLKLFYCFFFAAKNRFFSYFR